MILKGCVSEIRVAALPALTRPKANILIDRSGHACLADFSFSSFTTASDESTAVSSWADGGTLQWMSPELLDPESFDLGKKARPTKESDYYALGMVVYEVLSGQTPFAPTRGPVVVWRVLEGKRPARPQGDEGKQFTDVIWSVLERCWKHQPSDRPSAKTVLLCLEGPLLLSRQSSGMGGVVETDTDHHSDTTASNSGTFSRFVQGPGLTWAPGSTNTG